MTHHVAMGVFLLAYDQLGCISYAFGVWHELVLFKRYAHSAGRLEEVSPILFGLMGPVGPEVGQNSCKL